MENISKETAREFAMYGNHIKKLEKEIVELRKMLDMIVEYCVAKEEENGKNKLKA